MCDRTLLSSYHFIVKCTLFSVIILEIYVMKGRLTVCIKVGDGVGGRNSVTSKMKNFKIIQVSNSMRLEDQNILKAAITYYRHGLDKDLRTGTYLFYCVLWISTSTWWYVVLQAKRVVFFNQLNQNVTIWGWWNRRCFPTNTSDFVQWYLKQPKLPAPHIAFKHWYLLHYLN